MTVSGKDLMSDAISVWVENLKNEPGWKEWRRKRLSHTLYFDDPFSSKLQSAYGDFTFSSTIEKQHDIIIQYLGLVQTIDALKDCEYYFRRYPFRGLPVTRYGHLTNVCEMYFSRFYEFKERMKKYLNTIKAVNPNHRLKIGEFIKLFEKEFDQELRVRNGVHHDSRFEDIAIDRVFLTEALSLNDKGWKHEHMVAYRKLVAEWAKRVRVRASKMDEFLEAIAKASLLACKFLQPSQPKTLS